MSEDMHEFKWGDRVRIKNLEEGSAYSYLNGTVGTIARTPVGRVIAGKVDVAYRVNPHRFKPENPDAFEHGFVPGIEEMVPILYFRPEELEPYDAAFTGRSEDKRESDLKALCARFIQFFTAEGVDIGRYAAADSRVVEHPYRSAVKVFPELAHAEYTPPSLLDTMLDKIRDLADAHGAVLSDYTIVINAEDDLSVTLAMNVPTGKDAEPAPDGDNGDWDNVPNPYK